MRANDRIIELGVLFTVIFTCLAFGAMEVWSVAVMEVLVLILLTIWATDMIGGGNIRLAKTPLNIPLLSLVAIPFFQLVPLPAFLLQHLSYNSYIFYLDTFRAVSIEMRARNPISLYPHATWNELFKLLSYAGLFFIIINNIRRERVKGLLRIMVAFGLLLAIFGIFQHLSGAARIYWFREQTPSFFGPFFNRNAFAGYIGMLIPLGLGLFVSSLPLNKRNHIHRPLFYLFSTVIMVVALFLTLSRGGIISLMISLSFFTLLYRSSKTGTRKPSVVLILLLIVFIYLVWIGITPIIERLSTLSHFGEALESRTEIWQATLSIFRDFPLLGTGLGSFEYVFPAYKLFGSYSVVTHAENDYLQFLSETGVAGGISALLFISALLRLEWETMSKTDEDTYPLSIKAGLISGMIPVLTYGTAERMLYIPAIAILFTLYAALICCIGSGINERH